MCSRGGFMFKFRAVRLFKNLSVAAGLVTAALISESQAAVEIKYSTGVTEKQRELLTRDLARVATLRFGDASGEARRILRLRDFSGPELEDWLQTRARYIIDEKHPLNGFTLFAMAPGEYPVAGDAAPAQAPASPQKTQADGVPTEAFRAEGGGGTPSANEPTIVMGNMGAGLYMAGRQNKVVVGFNMLGQGLIPITSPRVGLFQVGRGLFQPLSPKWAPEVIEDFVHSMFRMDTLFHEARHSDGSTKNAARELGFAHEICPPGHEFAGFPACDRPSNGPYRVGALMMKGAIEGCDPDCTTRDKEILTLLYADSMSRILTPVTRAAQIGQNDLCAKLLRTRTNIPFCEAPEADLEHTVLEWEETPEAVQVTQRAPKTADELSVGK